jgi:hypothetical protein
MAMSSGMLTAKLSNRGSVENIVLTSLSVGKDHRGVGGVRASPRSLATGNRRNSSGRRGW